MKSTIGKIKRVHLKEVWKHEARDFTTWLVDNIDVLNDVLDVNLTSPEREQSTGNFRVDIVAEEEGGNLVIIENQLEKSDHDHLGKLITYLVAMDAKIAIWIVSNPRPEHINAITWLNESSSASFYLFKVEAIIIGGSAPAPLFTLIVGPSEEGKEIGDKKKELAGRYDLRYRFWTGLIEKAKSKSSLHGNISPTKESWISAGSGKAGLTYNYGARQHDSQVELYIDAGKDCEQLNEALFDQLFSKKEEIKAVFGEPLDWQRLEGRRACRIRKVIDIGGYIDEEIWSEIHEAMSDAMMRLEKALKPHIKKLKGL